MPHPLEQILDRLRRCLRRWLVVGGLGRLAAVVVGTGLALGLFDRATRFDDRGMRIMLTVTWLVASMWALWRWAFLPCTARLDRLELARRLGRHFAELGDDLPGAVEFLSQNDDEPSAGSPAMRQAVIEQTTARAESIDFASVVDRRSPMRGVLLGVVASLTAATVFLLAPDSSRIALARLLGPTKDVAWLRPEPPVTDALQVERPSIRSFSIFVRPPDYTGLPASQAKGQPSLLRGSRITIHAEADKPLRRAVLRLDEGQSIACRIDPAKPRRLVSDEFTPRRSGYYDIDLIDRQGVRGEERREIRLTDDRPPVASIDLPAAENTFVVPEAVLPLLANASDDFGLRRINLEIVSRDGRVLSHPQTIAIYHGPARAAATDDSQNRGQTVDYLLNLAKLKTRPGEELVFRVSAEDYLSQTTRSETRHIKVLSRDQWLDRLAQRQRRLLDDLGRALQWEQKSRRQLIQAQASPRMDQGQLDRIRSIELTQRDVERILTDADDGALARIERMQTDLQNNRIKRPDIQQRLADMAAELDRLARRVLPEISRGLGDAIRSTEAQKESPPRVADFELSLDRAAQAQDEAIASLERLCHTLNQWSDYQRLHERWDDMLERQRTLAGRTDSLGREQLGHAADDVAPETAARLQRLTEDQLELARHLDELTEETSLASQTLAGGDPNDAKYLADAADRSRQWGTSRRMRDAGDATANNRLALTSRLQMQTIDELTDIADRLARRRRDEPVQLVQTVRSLRERQIRAAEHTKRLDSLRPTTDKQTEQRMAELSKTAQEQHSLRRETADLGNMLDANSPDRAALDEAARQMAVAAGRLTRRNASGQVQQAQATAIERLSELLDSLIKQTVDKNGKPTGKQTATSNTPSSGQTETPGGKTPSTNGHGSQQAGVGKTQGAPGASGMVQTPAGPAGNDDARRRAMLNELWGELPPRRREAILQLPPEEPLPDYERATEDYFRRLLEKKRQRERT